MGFHAYASELIGHIPKLPYELARLQINRAWEKIRRQRLWSFNIREANLFFPALVGDGTVSVTYGSPTIIGDATAAAQWSTQLLGVPVPLIQRQFRIGSSGPIYNITAVSTTVNPNDTLTLDEDYGYTTNASAGYAIYSAYKEAPETQFMRWKSVFDPTNGYPLVTGVPRQAIDIVDPTRGAQGQAYRVVDYRGNLTTGVPIYEFWPHQTSQITFRSIYEIHGDAFSNDDDALPPAIPESVLIDTALGHYAYPWAAANVGRYPELKGTNWIALKVDALNTLRKDMSEVMRRDEESVQQYWTLLRKTHGLYYPISGSFEQSHSSWNLNAP